MAWAQRADALAEVTGGFDLDPARDALDTSFYTPPVLAELMWDVLVRSGFGGGRVLDLGCGTGRFLAHAPAGLPVRYTGVEVDPIVADIATILHPDATIITGDATSVPLGANFDAAIGNLPFSGSRVWAGRLGRMPLHVACLARAAAALRPGALAAFVVSRYLMDSATNWRDTLGAHAEFVSAVRLPSRYFTGTDVVADVVIIRAATDSAEATASWPEPGDRIEISAPAGARTSGTATVNGYWRTHPRHVAGHMEATGFGPSPLRVMTAARDSAVATAFKVATATLPSQITATPASPHVVLADSDGRLEGSFHLVDGDVVRIVDGQLRPVVRATRELRALISLRDKAIALLDSESDWDTPDADLDAPRTELAADYQEYVRRFGALNRGTLVEGRPDPDTGMPKLSWRTPAMGGFRADPQYAVVLALEVYDRATGHTEPAPLLRERVNRPPTPVTTASSPAEALGISLGEGGIDLDRIAGLLGLADSDAAEAALGDLVFRDPQARGVLVTRRDYLAGNVREKLAVARIAVGRDPGYARNVAALEGVQPPWLTSTEIRIELGSPLLGTADVETFCREVLGADWARVDYEPLTSAWTVDASAAGAAAAITYGTEHKTPAQLLAAGLNGKVPVVYVDSHESGRSRRVRDPRATEAAIAALQTLADRFSAWVWEDADRTRRVVHDYNHRFSAHRERVADGSYLPMPRLSASRQLWSHQRDWIDHALAQPASMCCTPVGSGKTLAAIGLAVTLREMGIARKPMIAVPNHLIEAVAVEATQAFPSAKFLIVTRDDLARDARRLFAARCAANDWDAVLITHEGLESIPVPRDVEEQWLTEQLAEARAADQAAASGKQLSGMIRSLRGRLEELRARGRSDEATITFDQLGVDHLSVDEFDKYRRLPITTRADGFSLGSSARATDMFLKVWMLRSRHPHRPHYCGYTATPLVNTIAEAYIYQRYCDPQRLTTTGLTSFDSWAATFLRSATVIEMAPDGSGLRCKRRPSIIQNAPELRTMLAGFMFFNCEAGERGPIPDARFHILTAPPTKAAEAFMRSLVDRAEALRGGGRPQVGEDNYLRIVGDGRRLALQSSLVGVPETPGATTKLTLAADTIAAIHHRTSGDTFPGSPVPGGFQMVLCDQGTPIKGGNQTYGTLRQLLIDRGVPADTIRFVHDATNPRAREALFESCRSGRTRVCIGSTPKLGVGVNAQTRCIAIHHLDIVWTPAAYEQRNGRALRPGNHYAEPERGGAVDIYTYLTERTFDAVCAGIVETKAKTFAQIYSGEFTDREILDVGRTELTFAEIKSAASGNPLLLRQADLTNRVRTLRVERATQIANQRAALNRADTDDQTADLLCQRRDIIAAAAAASDDLIAHPWDFADEITYVTSELSWLSTVAAAPGISVAADLGTRLGGHVLRFYGMTTGSRYRHHATQLDTITVPGNVSRRKPDNYNAWLVATTRDWLRSLPDRPTELDEQIARLRESADCARTAAADPFARQAELDTAAADLAAITDEIADLAANHSRSDVDDRRIA
ncbi:helicase-related protein [Gordonia alkanivorans]|uniref:helicase-related protein n=1 Tax=Gordonia alkanivorans TaxID=84096 RepID=UPI0004ADE0B8|nr:helicase-related protein [Gordonia alkanivorans]